MPQKGFLGGFGGIWVVWYNFLYRGGFGEEKPLPPEAPGYSTRLEIAIVVTTGRLKLLSPAVSLPAEVELIEDIEYGKVGKRTLKLDLYKPKKIEKLVPGLVFIHGGAGVEAISKYTDYTRHVMRLLATCL